MAALTAHHAAHATLTAATVDTVTLDQPIGWVEVLNRDASAVIYVTANGVDPTVAGNDTLAVPAGQKLILPTQREFGAATVKLISSAAAAYSVQVHYYGAGG